MLSNFSVQPGDVIYSDVWVGDSVGNKSLTGGYAWFYYELNGWAWSGCIGPGANCAAHPTMGQVFQGNAAEGIMEGGLFQGTFYPLANYGTASMWLLAFDSSGGIRTFFNGTPSSTKNLRHATNNNWMSQGAQQSGTNNITFTWKDYQ